MTASLVLLWSQRQVETQLVQTHTQSHTVTHKLTFHMCIEDGALHCSADGLNSQASHFEVCTTQLLTWLHVTIDVHLPAGWTTCSTTAVDTLRSLMTA